MSDRSIVSLCGSLKVLASTFSTLIDVSYIIWHCTRPITKLLLSNAINSFTQAYQHAVELQHSSDVIYYKCSYSRIEYDHRHLIS